MVECGYCSAPMPQLCPIDFGTLLDAETCDIIHVALFDSGYCSLATCSVADAEIDPTTGNNGLELLG